MEAGDCPKLNMNAMKNYLLSQSLIAIMTLESIVTQSFFSVNRKIIEAATAASVNINAIASL